MRRGCLFFALSTLLASLAQVSASAGPLASTVPCDVLRLDGLAQR